MFETKCYLTNEVSSIFYFRVIMNLSLTYTVKTLYGTYLKRPLCSDNYNIHNLSISLIVIRAQLENQI